MFDVDGVLIDTRRSFRRAVQDVVVAVQRLAGRPHPWRPAAADIARLKAAGGFNSDIDCSIHLARLALETPRGSPDVARLAAPSRSQAAVGGVDAGLVERLFAERYWGAEAFAHHFGEPARHFAGPGLRTAERLLAPPHLLPALRGRGVEAFALITGRTRLETTAALELLRWPRDGFADGAVVTGEELLKPDPAALDRVTEACGTVRGLFVGDVRDDAELVRRYRGRPGAVDVRLVLVGPMAGARRAWAAHAGLHTVAQLPQLLDELAQAA
ncbi:MAG TPA: hypothetical protein VMW49_05735 [Candidatus Dormibacteraeota bacterium]|nr:hypothetical protein [Candidatus Dormibacteraeota bacterium]